MVEGSRNIGNWRRRHVLFRFSFSGIFLFPVLRGIKLAFSPVPLVRLTWSCDLDLVLRDEKERRLDGFKLDKPHMAVCWHNLAMAHSPTSDMQIPTLALSNSVDFAPRRRRPIHRICEPPFVCILPRHALRTLSHHRALLLTTATLDP